jgi:hypothetical protein
VINLVSALETVKALPNLRKLHIVAYLNDQTVDLKILHSCRYLLSLTFKLYGTGAIDLTGLHEHPALNEVATFVEPETIIEIYGCKKGHRFKHVQ